MPWSLLDLDRVQLCVETYGESTHPAILLIAGSAQSMDWWEDDFCRRLAAYGRLVIRYDHRDTGQSISSPAGEPTYTSKALAEDPLRILDALDIEAAHLVGMSMGGGIAQYLAVEHPTRVRSLTLIAATPAGPSDGASALPPPAPQVAATFTVPYPEPDWTDRDAVIDYRVEVERPYAGSLGFDEPRFRAIATHEVDRTTNMAASLTNHFLLDDWSRRLDLGEVRAPTLVLHGTTDPLFPFEHGEALARAIPGAKVVPLPGMGHEIPPPVLWDLVIPRLAEHTADSTLSAKPPGE